MSAKDPRREQKRQAKLKRRARKEKSRKDRQRPDAIRPYRGTKYQAQRWVPQVYQTELAIYETIQLSGGRLTNEQVRQAFVQLIRRLKDGLPPALPVDEPSVPFAGGLEVIYLVGNIRSHWRTLFEEEGPTNVSDLIGILRTLLYSIQAHASPVSPYGGYVQFLNSFMRDIHR